MPNGEMSMSSSDRGTEGGKNSHKTDPNCEVGVHRKQNGEISRSTLERVSKAGKESAATIDGEKTGVHWKRQGEDKGKVLTMPMSERGEKSAGVPRTGNKESKILVLYHEDKIYFSRTNPPMLQKMVELELFSSEKSAENSIPRLKKYGQEVEKFQLKPGRRGGKKEVHYRGACGSKMPADLDVWMSVGTVPKDGNVTELVLQAKRKRVEDD
jgi:hypothetical protein